MPVPIAAIRREGLTILSESEIDQVDIIILHGLNGHPYKTFAHEESGFYWPAELVNSVPKSRVMTFGYNADFKLGSSNLMGIRQHAENLLLCLRHARPKPISGRPLFVIAHSLGGLVAKQAIIRSRNSPLDAEVGQSMKLLIFLGTPHRGSHALDKALFQAGIKLLKAATAKTYDIPRELRATLTPRSNELYVINEDFMRIKGSFAILNIYEQKIMTGMSELIVDKDSAVLHSEYSENYGFYRDHRELARFSGITDELCQRLFGIIKEKMEAVNLAKEDTVKTDFLRTQREACMKSLGHVPLTRQIEIPDAYDNTLRWLFTDDDKTSLKNWLTDGRGLYSFTGKPGTGKSVLMKHAYLETRKRYSQTKTFTARHFFNNRGTPQERSFNSFLQSLVLQFIHHAPHLFEHLLKEWQYIQEQDQDLYRDTIHNWNIDSLKRGLNDILDNWPPTVTGLVFIDALDECEDMPLRDFLPFLERLSITGSGDSIKICFSTRSIPPSCVGGHVQEVIMQERNTTDIETFVDGHWAPAFNTYEQKPNMRLLRDEIIRKADGLFLWVDLVLNEMRSRFDDGDTVSELREAVKDIPDQLSGLFNLLLENVDKKYHVERNAMLGLVLAASRPLTCTEFRFALALAKKEFSSQRQMKASNDLVQTDETMRNRIRSRCGGLLEIRTVGAGEENVVQFIHQSVKDHVLSKKDITPGSQGTMLIEGHKSLAISCVNYLRLDEFSNMPLSESITPAIRSAYMDNFPFLNYSLWNWPKHFGQTERNGGGLIEIFESFVNPTFNHFNNWLSMMWYLYPEERENSDIDITPLHIAVATNLPRYVERQLTKGVDPNTSIGNHGTYLQLAVSNEAEEVVKVLLDHGALVTPLNTLKDPLTKACEKGNITIVKHLLDCGSLQNEHMMFRGSHWELTLDGESWGNNPLAAAASSGNWEVVQLLLEYDASVLSNSWNRYKGLLGLVIGNIKRLDMEIFCNSKSLAQPHRMSRTLSTDDKRVKSMDVRMMNALWTSDVPMLSNRLFYEPLVQWVLVAGSITFLRQLIEQKIDLSTRGSSGETLLFLVCLQDSQEAAQILVENGAEIDVEIQNGWTLLHAAAHNQSPATLRYLLKLGLDPNVVSNGNMTPLHCAAQYGTTQHIELLLDNGAIQASLDSWNWAPLHYALRNERVNTSTFILGRLISVATDINSQTRSGLSPLMIASKSGSLSSVKWALEMGADCCAVDSMGRTALHAAASNSSVDSVSIIKILIAKGLSVADTDDAGSSPLHCVLYTPAWDDDEDEDEDEDENDEEESPFDPIYARANAQALIQYGANVNAQDGSGNTLLHFAAWKGHKYMVKMLLKEGADKNIEDVQGKKPIDLAREDDIRELLEPF